MKKLINEAHDVVPQMLEGFAMLTPGIRLLRDAMAVVDDSTREQRAAGRVAIISGGGAGHEPAHAGYVGAGMLSAAVAGDVFTSPSTDAVLAAIREVAGPGGVLLIVKNYTGDRLNFGLAAEIARTEGIAVEMMIVADDVALPDSGHAGARGIAGTVLVHKVAGAAAAAGLSLDRVKAEAEAAAAGTGTMGVALSPCIVPAAGHPSFELGDSEIELGLGIHGEAGVRRETMRSADALVDELLSAIVDRQRIGTGERVAVLVNNLGGSPTMEMYIVARAALAGLARRGVTVERAWCGTFLTALEMAGCSISVMKVDDARLERLDQRVSAPAWPQPFAPASPRLAVAAASNGSPVPTVVATSDEGDESRLRDVLLAVCAALEAAEPELTQLDRVVGDGDLGISLARGAQAIRERLAGVRHASAVELLRDVSATVRRSVGGTSGPLYAVLLLRAATELDRMERQDAEGWAVAFTAGCVAVSELGGAVEGDRTMLDALMPAARAVASAIAEGRSAVDAAALAAEAAARGRDVTAGLEARRGRSSYLGERTRGHVDPGAAAVVLWMASIAKALGA